MSRRNKIFAWLATSVLLLLVLIWAAGPALSAIWVAPFARQRLVAMLQERFHGRVELSELRVSGLLWLTIEGQGLVIRSRHQADALPLIRVGRFSASAGLLGLMRTPRRVGRVRLEGLEINVPPSKGPGGQGRGFAGYRIVVDEIVSQDARLTILPKRAGKLPIVFDIHRVILRSAGPGQSMWFRASLTNPKPVGEIEATGHFGPWQAEDPSLTPVSGRYAFTNADLNTIRGIGGILSSSGQFTGVLERIAVQGETNAGNFSVDIGGNPVPLRTRFNAVVDGTSGDTLLDPVEGRLAQSLIVARGSVAKSPDGAGRIVALDVSIPDGRLDDVLRLAVKGPMPPMTGPIRLETRFYLPPGSERIAQRLRLSGSFRTPTTRFTNLGIQEKVTTLSQKGRAKPDEPGTDVASNLEGEFQLKDGRCTFSKLTFEVPGAAVRLRGSYNLLDGTLDFRGTLALKAKLSEMTTGVKSVLLKAADPWFSRKGAGTLLPIRVTGTAKKPQFGVDIGKALKRKE